MRRLLIPMCLIATLLQPAEAAAGDDDDAPESADAAAVAFGPIETSEGIPARLTKELDAALVAGLSSSGLSVVDASEVERILGTFPELNSCRDGPCLSRLGELLSIQYVASASVVRVGDDYLTSLSLVRIGWETAPVTTEDTCEVCPFKHVAKRLTILASALRGKLDAARRAAETAAAEEALRAAEAAEREEARIRAEAEADAARRAAADAALRKKRRVTGRWWFWTAIGAVAVGGGTLAAILLAPRSDRLPEVTVGTIDGR